MPTHPSASAPTLAVGLLLATLATGGCTRTSDGSFEPIVAMPGYSLAGLGRREAPKPQSTAFPPAPRVAAPRQRARRSKAAVARVPTLNIASRPLLKSAEPSKPATEIACRNVTMPGGRVRVVCD